MESCYFRLRNGSYISVIVNIDVGDSDSLDIEVVVLRKI